MLFFPSVGKIRQQKSSACLWMFALQLSQRQHLRGLANDKPQYHQKWMDITILKRSDYDWVCYITI